MNESTNTKGSDYQKLKPRELFDVSLWVVKFVFKISPKFTSVAIITSTLRRLMDLGNTLILAKLLDAVATSIQTKHTDFRQMYMFLAVILIFNITQTIINLADSWAFSGLRVSGRPKVRREFYTKLNSLGIQTLEQPHVNDRIFRADNYIGNVTGYLEDTVSIISSLIRAVVLLIVISGFLPVFVPIIIIATIPGFLYDKRERSRLYRHINENTEDQRKANSSENNLTNTRNLQEVTLTQGFNFLDNKFWSFQKNFTDKDRKTKKREFNIELRKCSAKNSITITGHTDEPDRGVINNFTEW